MKNCDWNLIETAPKDGTEILVYCENSDKIYKASYLDINDNHIKPKVKADFYTSCMHWVVPESYIDSSYYVIVDPIYWMSLPTKPIKNNYDIEHIKKLIIEDCVEYGYNEDDASFNVNEAKITIDNNVITIEYSTNTTDIYHLINNKLIFIQ